MSRWTAGAAVSVAFIAFLLYRSTLLPGLDFGDTPSFQVMAGEAAITPRDGYPLYFALGSPIAWLAGDRAHGLNLASAVEGALASGLVVLVAAELSGALVPAVAAALLFAGSYTFWSQSIIAEVYALHAGLIVLALWLLLRWERIPTYANLACFFAVYALAFGNHLSMILFVPPFAVFLLTSAPGGWRPILSRRVVTLALALAAAGALQYAWNFRSLWLAPVPPRTFTEGMRIFWFDVTKADWRDTMMANVPRAMYSERLRMYAFDVRQQFGWAGPLVATCGIVHLLRRTPRRAWLLLLAYTSNVLFALTYNVGDSHVFFLPSHLMIALLVAPGLTMLESLVSLRLPAVASLAVLLAGMQIYQNYPALDRSADRRPTELLSALTEGLDDRRAILIADLNWQVQNGLTYFAKFIRPDVAVARMPDVQRYVPALVRDNIAIGRDVFQTHVQTSSLANLTSGLPPGTRYVLSILKPTRDSSIDISDLETSVQQLTGSPSSAIEQDGYAAIAGLVGDPPALVISSVRPFRESVRLNGVDVAIRMESWLAFDTIRRMGFGQVIAARHHTLIIERGVSFAAFDDQGRPLRVGYAANIFAPQERFVLQPLGAR